MDADTKLCVSYLVGGRDAGWACDLMQDCASRIASRVQVTTDGHRAYLDAVDNHAHMVAIHFLHYNFARICKTLRVTPAMEAGLSDHIWTLEEIVMLAS